MSNISIGDFCQKVKLPPLRTSRPSQVLAVRQPDSFRRVLLRCCALANEHGFFDLDASRIAEQTGLSRRSVYLAIAALERQGLVARVHFRTGRGRHSVYQLRVEQKSKPHEIDEKIVKKKCAKTGIRNIKNIQHTLKTAPARLGGGSSPRRDPTAYQGPEAGRVVLVMGARFYRHAMRQTRIGLESWELPEPIRHALEGFIGLRIDGASLASARELVAKIWAMRAEIEALARSGASPRRVCAFVAGRLSGKPDRSRREVLRRTAELIRESLDLERIERRIQGLRRFAAEREAEYRAGQVCRRCGYRHTQIEYETGYRADGTGALSCFGWARIKLEELHEQAKLAERRRRELCCRQCGGSLREGQVEGLCWSCWAPRRENLRQPPLRLGARTREGARLLLLTTVSRTWLRLQILISHEHTLGARR
jgi:DNA-binding MarR family transcriptional regulator